MTDVDVVICHLTRMGDERVCVAAVDESGRHLRPVLRGEHDWCTADVGPHGALVLGAVVRLPDRPGGPPPHTEDVVTRRAAVVPKERLEYDTFVARLRTQATSLEDAFGAAHATAPNTSRLVIAPGTGAVSLAIVRAGPVDAYVRRERFYLLLEHDRLGPVELSLADHRFLPWEAHGELWRIAEVLGRGGAVLTIGLSRPWGVETSWCWGQVNGIFVDEPALTGW